MPPTRHLRQRGPTRSWSRPMPGRARTRWSRQVLSTVPLGRRLAPIRQGQPRATGPPTSRRLAQTRRRTASWQRSPTTHPTRKRSPPVAIRRCRRRRRSTRRSCHDHRGRRRPARRRRRCPRQGRVATTGSTADPERVGRRRPGSHDRDGDEEQQRCGGDRGRHHATTGGHRSRDRSRSRAPR